MASWKQIFGIYVLALYFMSSCFAKVAEENKELRRKRAVGFRPRNVKGSCGGSLSGRSGFIASPNFPQNQYPPLSVCNWTITVNSGNVVRFSFVYMDLEDAPVQKLSDCSADYISIYDESTPDTLIGNQRFCGYDTVFNPVFSQTNVVSVDFESDGLFQRSGFALRWQAVRPQNPMVSCDFEMSNGVCAGWEQLKDDDFDWTLRHGRTPSGKYYQTGPRFDHTFGPRGDVQRGAYAYIEASSRSRGDEAVLATPAVSLTAPANCLNIWYHMRGSGIGALQVFQVSEGQPRTSGRMIFERRGDMKDVWRSEKISISGGGSPVKFLFVGIRGDSFQGDIAIDDINLMESRCN